ncbi:MAG: hypothetical protein CMI63_14315 [Parvularcula sp.]|nr:hypothetical protein [Parvularcula sp.]
MTARLSIRRGSIYLSAEACDTYFRGLDAVIVLIRNDALHVLPVQQMTAGGHLLKMRNAKGDRVVSAPDVFLEYGLADWESDDLAAHWSADHGALVCTLPKMQTKFA